MRGLQFFLLRNFHAILQPTLPKRKGAACSDARAHSGALFRIAWKYFRFEFGLTSLTKYSGLHEINKPRNSWRRKSPHRKPHDHQGNSPDGVSSTTERAVASQEQWDFEFHQRVRLLKEGVAWVSLFSEAVWSQGFSRMYFVFGVCVGVGGRSSAGSNTPSETPTTNPIWGRGFQILWHGFLEGERQACPKDINLISRRVEVSRRVEGQPPPPNVSDICR